MSHSGSQAARNREAGEAQGSPQVRRAFEPAERNRHPSCSQSVELINIVSSLDSPTIPRPDLGSVLTRVSQQAAEVTGAEGVAIAIGNATAMCCCASFGDAPAVGVLVGPQSGLSGLCMRTLQLVQCDDAASDARIDPVARQQMNLRSVLIVPVIADGRLQAMLQAVSRRPRAFDAEHRELLCHMAERIATLLSDSDGDLTKTKRSAPEDQAASNGRGGVVSPVPNVLSFAPAVRPLAAPRAADVGQKSEPAARRAQAERSQRFGPRPFIWSDTTKKFAGLIAIAVVLVVGVFVFTSVGRRRAGTAVPAAADNSGKAAPGNVSDSAPPEISIEQNSLAVGFEQLPTGGVNAPQLTPGRLLRRVEPVFPPALRGISGSVVLSARVEKDGSVTTVRVIRGPEELASPAIDAVRQWVYEPYRLGGVPVAAESTIIIRVKPRQQR